MAAIANAKGEMIEVARYVCGLDVYEIRTDTWRQSFITVSPGNYERTTVSFDNRHRGKFVKALKKGLKWMVKAKENKVDIKGKRIKLLRMNFDYRNYYSGNYEPANRLDITFTSENKGQKAKISIYFTDFDNQYQTNLLYFNKKQVEDLIKNLELIKIKAKELKNQIKKANKAFK